MARISVGSAVALGKSSQDGGVRGWVSCCPSAMGETGVLGSPLAHGDGVAPRPGLGVTGQEACVCGHSGKCRI